jgi:CelD/BcsL family acetyltransferase involved in cellulose biosynthesis
MSLRFHTDWSTTTFDQPPVAGGTGPFPKRDFLRTWWDERASSAELMLADSGSALLPLASSGGRVEFLGEPDLCDYHTPLGSSSPDLVTAIATALPGGSILSLDSLPEEAAVPIQSGLTRAGVLHTTLQHEVAAVLALPTTTPDWLASLTSKQRHEVRRKRRRFLENAGEPMLTTGGSHDVAAFAAMHRRAAGEKGSFMTEAMERWFTALVDRAGAQVHTLRGDVGTPLAAAIGFENEEAYYLYNSAYEPAAAHVSPGVVLVTELITRAITQRRTVFDFLKGDEPYKFQLGARPRPLYRIAATITS